MLILDEVIKNCEDLAEDLYERGKIARGVDCKYANYCGERADNNKQFADWLKDYKRLLNMVGNIKLEICEHAFTVTNPKNTYEDISVIDLETLDGMFDKYLGGTNNE